MMWRKNLTILIVLAFSLIVYIFGEDEFFHAAVDAVHHPNPGKLIPGFQFLCNTLLLCSLCCQHPLHPGAAFVHFNQLIVQLSGEDQGTVLPRMMFFQILHPHPAIFSNGTIILRHFEHGDVVIPIENIGETVLAIENLSR